MSAIFKLIFVELVFFLLGTDFMLKSIIGASNNSTLNEIPLIGVNFHLMGVEEDTFQLGQKIQENITFLNLEFENTIRFELFDVLSSPNRGFLPDLHADYFEQKEAIVDSLVRYNERPGFINIYIFDTYIAEDFSNELMGFTPVFKNSFEDYLANTPRYDRIFISYSALDKKTTLIHEMGHFFGLNHPWEMTPHGKFEMGLGSEEAVQVNHMSYGNKVATFTSKQLQSMRNFAFSYRNYLIKSKVYDFRPRRLAIAD